MDNYADNCMCPLCKTGHHVDSPGAYYLLCDSCADSVDLPNQPWEEEDGE